MWFTITNFFFLFLRRPKVKMGKAFDGRRVEVSK